MYHLRHLFLGFSHFDIASLLIFLACDLCSFSSINNVVCMAWMKYMINVGFYAHSSDIHVDLVSDLELEVEPEA